MRSIEPHWGHFSAAIGARHTPQNGWGATTGIATRAGQGWVRPCISSWWKMGHHGHEARQVSLGPAVHWTPL